MANEYNKGISLIPKTDIIWLDYLKDKKNINKSNVTLECVHFIQDNMKRRNYKGRSKTDNNDYIMFDERELVEQYYWSNGDYLRTKYLIDYYELNKCCKNININNGNINDLEKMYEKRRIVYKKLLKVSVNTFFRNKVMKSLLLNMSTLDSMINLRTLFMVKHEIVGNTSVGSKDNSFF